VVTPYFKAGDFPRGIEAGVDAIAARVSGEPLPAPPVPGQGGDGAMGLEELLVVGMIVTIVIGGILRAIFGRLLGATWPRVSWVLAPGRSPARWRSASSAGCWPLYSCS
jgi:uncharacterized protein